MQTQIKERRKTYKDGSYIAYTSGQVKRIDSRRKDGSFAHCLYDGLNSVVADRMWSDILREKLK